MTYLLEKKLKNKQLIYLVNLTRQDHNFRWYFNKKIPVKGYKFEKHLNDSAYSWLEKELEKVNHETFDKPRIVHYQPTILVCLKPLSGKEILKTEFDNAIFSARDESNELYGKELMNLFKSQKGDYFLRMIDLKHQGKFSEKLHQFQGTLLYFCDHVL